MLSATTGSEVAEHLVQVEDHFSPVLAYASPSNYLEGITNDSMDGSLLTWFSTAGFCLGGTNPAGREDGNNYAIFVAIEMNPAENLYRLLNILRTRDLGRSRRERGMLEDIGSCDRVQHWRPLC